MSPHITLTAIAGIPLIHPGDDLSAILIDAFERNTIRLQDGDIVVIAQKIVSKAEGRYVDLNNIQPSLRANELAQAVDKDPRLVEVILSESEEVLRYRPGVLIVVHRLGFVLANAGVDRSNIESQGDERVLLLPQDPDASCVHMQACLAGYFGVELGVIINDSIGRAWRNGTVGTAIGVASVPALVDLRGKGDLFGRELLVSQVGFADEVAAAASMLMGQSDEGLPVVLVRGLEWQPSDDGISALLRPKQLDLFR